MGTKGGENDMDNGSEAEQRQDTGATQERLNQVWTGTHQKARKGVSKDVDEKNGDAGDREQNQVGVYPHQNAPRDQLNKVEGWTFHQKAKYAGYIHEEDLSRKLIIFNAPTKIRSRRISMRRGIKSVYCADQGGHTTGKPKRAHQQDQQQEPRGEAQGGVGLKRDLYGAVAMAVVMMSTAVDMNKYAKGAVGMLWIIALGMAINIVRTTWATTTSPRIRRSKARRRRGRRREGGEAREANNVNYYTRNFVSQTKNLYDPTPGRGLGRWVAGDCAKKGGIRFPVAIHSLVKGKSQVAMLRRTCGPTLMSKSQLT